MTNDKMDLSHVSEKFHEIVHLPNEHRAGFINNHRWIAYPAAKRVIDELNALVSYPRQTRMPSMLIIGKPNNGKSSILEKFEELNPPSDENSAEDDLIIPVMKVEASRADAKFLYIEILSKLWAPFLPTQTLAVLRYQAVNIMRDKKLKVLMIDEFHSLISGTRAQQQEVLREIRYLSNTLHLSIVGAGTSSAVNVTKHDAQYTSRFTTIELPTWSLNQDYLRLLLSFEQGLPLRKPSNLATPEKAKAILSKSEGVLGNIHAIIKRSAIEAIRSGSESITMEIINKQPWQILRGK